MISNLDPSAELFLADLTRSQQTMASAQRQISSGRRVQAAEDAPDQIDTILQLRAAQEHNKQVQSNLSRGKTEADTAEATLSNSTKLLDRAQSLAAEALNPTQNADTRKALAQEVQSIQEQLVNFSKTTVEGRMIFSGDQDQSATYQIDLQSATGVDRLIATQASRQIEDPSGGTFAVGKTAQDIFDARNSDDTIASGNVFNALNTLRLALLGNDTAGINNAIPMVKQSSDYLNQQLAFYGSVQTRIQDATDFAARYDSQLQTNLSNEMDADVTAAAMQLTQTNTQIQASLEARAKLPRTSLFDLLG